MMAKSYLEAHLALYPKVVAHQPTKRAGGLSGFVLVQTCISNSDLSTNMNTNFCSVRVVGGRGCPALTFVSHMAVAITDASHAPICLLAHMLVEIRL